MSSHVQIKFISKNLSIPSTPIRVPSNFRRFGLSEIVNHLLLNNQKENNEKKMFDFMVNGKLLRQSLEELIKETDGMSMEYEISVEVIESIMPPCKLDTEYPHQDWISSSMINGEHSLVLTGSFDGSIRVCNFDDGSQSLLESTGNNVASIKSVEWLTNSEFLSGSTNGMITFWSTNTNTTTTNNNNNNYKPCIQFKGHEGSIESLHSLSSTSFLSGSKDGSVRLWNTNAECSDTQVEMAGQGRKRTKINVDLPIVSHCERVFEGHSDTVTGISSIQSGDGVFFTCSLDTKLCEFNMEDSTCIRTFGCSSSALCLDIGNTLLASGHSDKSVRVWDSRVGGGEKLVKIKFKGHSNWVSGVRWSRENDNHLATCSYDGTVKIWDIRSNKDGSLYTLQASKDKLFALDWRGGVIVTGGEDKQLKVYKN